MACLLFPLSTNERPSISETNEQSEKPLLCRYSAARDPFCFAVCVEGKVKLMAFQLMDSTHLFSKKARPSPERREKKLEGDLKTIKISKCYGR